MLDWLQIKNRSSWRETTWGDLAELRYGRSLQGYQDQSSGYPVYGTNGHIGWTNKPLSEEGGIIVGRKGAYRGIHFSEKPFYVIDTAYYLVPKASFNRKWAYYSLLTQDINGMDSGSAIPSTSREDFYSLKVNVPPRGEQDYIVKVLDSFNAKIELNAQLNQTLESMARALFKSWFVDFDPVIDNAIAAGNPIPEAFQSRAERRRLRLHEPVPDGQSPFQPLPAELRQLFPNSFQETEELGWVPEGWEHKFLKDIVNIKYGKNLPTSKLVKEGFPVFGGNGVIGFYNYFLYEHPHVLIACRGAASGKVLLSLPKSYVTNNSLIVEHGDSGLNAYFLFNSLSIQDLGSLTSGSAQPQMTIDNLNPVRILVPSRNLLDTFNKVTSVLYLKQLANSGESEVLVEIRNKLIPKLLSGQLRIPDAEAQLAEAGL